MRTILQFIGRRRWALFFLLLVAGLFAAPYLYWSAILMPVVLQAAREEPVLLWANLLSALGSVPLLMLAALGAGGCLSALRKMRRSEDGYLPGEVFGGMRTHAKASLPAGAVLGLSLGAMRAGLLHLHTLLPGGAVRTLISSFLVLQFILAIWTVITPPHPLRGSSPKGEPLKKRVVMPALFALDALLLLLPPLLLGMGATLRETLAFVSRLYAGNGTLLRGLLAASGVWPILLAALLGSACCIMAAFACACYKFRLRGLVFTAAVLLQILPMLASYSSLEQLLRHLELPVTGVLLGLVWAGVYLLAALLLLRRFAQLLPSLQKNREKYPGVRLFFYYALPRAPLLSFTLAALATLGCWNDALAPFWYMRRLGAFSLWGYLWERLAGWGELATYACVFLVMLGLFIPLRGGVVRRTGVVVRSTR